MFGFVTDLVNSVTGNSGSKSPTSGAKAGLTDAVKNIGAGSEQRAGQDNVQGSDAAAGYTGGGAAGGQPGGTELDVTRITSDPETKKNKVVGTSVNVPNPNNSGSFTTFKGFPSLFNPYYLVRYHAMTDDSEKQSYITDLNAKEGTNEYKGLAQYEQYKNPSTSLIISHYSKNGPGEKMPERSYSYSDFLYLKDYHPFNNNRLITLRRFMAPVYDELRVAIKAEGEKSPLRRPIAQALTYLDTSDNKLSDFTKMTVKINTKDIKGAGQNNEAITIKELEDFAGVKGALGNATGNVAQAGIKLLSILSGANGNQTALKNWTSAYDPWKNGPLQDLVYGPVNVVTGAKVRDRGLSFTQTKFTVNFEYSSKTIENVNQKAAMLDILSNTLALTYNHALFWGGENRYLIGRANFPLVRTEAVFSLLSDLNNVSKLKENLAKQTTQGGKAVIDSVTGFWKDFIDKGVGAFTDKTNQDSIAQIAAQYFLADNEGLKQTQRMVLEQTKATLTGAPTGEWHLQVGNPFAPIMMIGNLWCISTSMEFNDELSIDDFPTEFKFSCTLDHGRDRDASDIQSIFNAGGGRIYYPYPDATTDVNASSSTYTTESQVKNKSTEVINGYGRSATDAVGKNIADLVKINTKGESQKKIQAQIFQPIGSLFK